MNTKTDEGLYEKARKLFISKASIDEFAGWATPRQVDAVHRLLDTELANRERAKHDRLLRRARFPVVKGLDGYDFTNVRLPDGYMLDELLGLGFIPRAQDLVFYGKTGRGKTHLAIGLGMKAIDMGLGVRFHQTAELVLQLGKAKRDGTLETMLRDIGRADLIILDEFGYVPFDIDGARLLYQIIAGSYERRSIIFTTNIEFSKWGTVFADDKLAAAIIDRIVHHGRLLEFTGQSLLLLLRLHLRRDQVVARRHALVQVHRANHLRQQRRHVQSLELGTLLSITLYPHTHLLRLARRHGVRGDHAVDGRLVDVLHRLLVEQPVRHHHRDLLRALLLQRLRLAAQRVARQ